MAAIFRPTSLQSGGYLHGVYDLTGVDYIIFPNFVPYNECMFQENLGKNWNFVKKNFDSLLNTYRDKYVLVGHERVMGSYDTFAAAANAGIFSFGKSGFIVRHITEKKPLNIIASAIL